VLRFTNDPRPFNKTDSAVENPYVSVVRVPGKLLLLPSLLEAERRQDSGKVDRQNSLRSVSISKIVLDNGTMELFDATVSKPPQKIRLEQSEPLFTTSHRQTPESESTSSSPRRPKASYAMETSRSQAGLPPPGRISGLTW
jgi:hypothetical protein